MVNRHTRTVRRAYRTAGTAIITLAAIALSPVAQAAPTPTPSPGALTGAQAKTLATGKKSGVIVMLRNQHPETPATKAKRAARRALVAKEQQPYLTELKQVGAAKVQ